MIPFLNDLYVVFPRIFFPALMVLGIIFYWKNRNRISLCLAIGLLCMGVGVLIQWLCPLTSVTYAISDGQKVFHERINKIWYIGSIFVEFGLLWTTILFGYITFKRSSSNSEQEIDKSK